MATVIYTPNYSIDQINNNFANKGSQTSVADFIAANFTESSTSIADTVPSIVPPPTPVDMNLVAQIFADYGNGPVGNGLQIALTLINNNVQTGTFQVGDVFGNYILAGGTTDFRYVTNAAGTQIVLQNLQMNTLLPLVSTTYQSTFDAVVLNIVRDLRIGNYDYNNYLSLLLPQARSIAQILLNTYGT